jgi:hypothetical protein
MVAWKTDEGLAALAGEWRREHPGATVYFIGDTNHSVDPDVSQHAPDDGKSGQAGDTKGEVDAGDFMPGKGVTDADLDELAEGLRLSRDPRIMYVIRRQRIFSATVQPFVWRPYNGKYHGHTHVSVNDKYRANTADWKWEPVAPRVVQFETASVKLPVLKLGDDDDVLPGWNHIGRAQALANWLDNSTPDVDLDGVYGPKTAAKFGKAVKAGKSVNTLNLPVWRTLMGLSS